MKSSHVFGNTTGIVVEQPSLSVMVMDIDADDRQDSLEKDTCVDIEPTVVPVEGLKDTHSLPVLFQVNVYNPDGLSILTILVMVIILSLLLLVLKVVIVVL